MAYRVIQWSTGNVGGYALRAILGHPELELAGVWVHSAEKAGRDAGELCGLPAGGRRRHQRRRRAARPRRRLRLLHGDRRPAPVRGGRRHRPHPRLRQERRVELGRRAWCIRSRCTIDITGQLEEACRAGTSSFLTSGIDPGFANDMLPLVLSGLCERWEEVRILEIINYATYDQPEVLFDTMGFGKPLDHTPMLLMPGALCFGWGGTVRLLAEGLGVELDEIREVHERRPAHEADPDRRSHVVEPGTMGALRFEVQGIVDGRPAMVVEHVTRLDDDLAPGVAHGQRQLPGVHQGRLPTCSASSSSGTSTATTRWAASCSRRRGS